MAVVRDGLSGELQGHAFRVLVLTYKDAGDLLSAIETQMIMPQSSSRIQAIVSIAREVARRNPNAAFQWFDRLTDIDERKDLHGSMMDAFGEAKDEGSLIALLEVTPPEEQIKPGGTQLWNRELLIRRVAWLRQQRGDSEGLKSFRDMLSDEETVIVDAVMIYANERIAPSDRINQLASLGNQQVKHGGISAVVSMELKKDPGATARMVWSLPDETFSSGVGALVNAWHRADQESLTAWIRALPPGPRREKAISSYVMLLRWNDKVLAKEVVSWLTEPEGRLKMESELRP